MTNELIVSLMLSLIVILTMLLGTFSLKLENIKNNDKKLNKTELELYAQKLYNKLKEENNESKIN